MRWNRQLPLLFVTLAATPAWAQSGLAVNGLLDIGVFRGFDGADQVGTIGRSNVAVSGAEDLGGGMKATFRLSTRLELDTGRSEGAGAKPFWHDEATVGLKGGFGAVRFGRALTALWAHDWKFDPWANNNRIASPAWEQWHYLTPSEPYGNAGGAEYGRLNNGIFYDSPTLHGLTLHLSLSPERQPEAGATGHPYSVALEYGGAAAAAMLAFERNSRGDRVGFVAGRYRFDAVTLTAAYDDSRGVADSGRSRAVTLGAAYQVGRATLKAGFGRQRLNDQTRRFASMGADYAFSKRTTLYASLGHRSYRSDAGNATAFGLGLSHAF